MKNRFSGTVLVAVSFFLSRWTHPQKRSSNLIVDKETTTIIIIIIIILIIINIIIIIIIIIPPLEIQDSSALRMRKKHEKSDFPLNYKIGFKSVLDGSCRHPM